MRFGLAMLAVMVLAACRDKAPPPAEGPPVRRIHAPGYFEPEGGLRKLAFADTELIAKIEVEMGAAVGKGDLLAQLESGVEEAELEKALADRMRAKAELIQLEAGAHPGDPQVLREAAAAWKVAVDYFTAEVDRLEKLEGKAVSFREADVFRFLANFSTKWLERVKAELQAELERVREVDLEVARASLKAAEARAEVAREALHQRELRAPMSGRVLEVLFREGERVAGGPVIFFAPDGNWRVRAEIDEGFIGMIREGQRAIVESPGGQVANGRVGQIKEMMGDKTVFLRNARERSDLQVFEAWIDLDDEPPGWPLGLEVRVVIDVAIDRK